MRRPRQVRASAISIHVHRSRRLQHTSASEYLRQQAEAEEREAATSNNAHTAPLQAEKPWDGEERIQDAVLRMIVDKYKPLRVEGWQKKIQTPTERTLEERQPTQTSQPPRTPLDRPLHPWEVQYTAPKHHMGLPSVRKGLIIPKPGAKRPVDLATRVAMAREVSVDYATGDTAKAKRAAKYGLDHVRITVRESEDRIQQAREAGAFRGLKGHGKPFERDWNESGNPHIDSTSFLMNRIVQQQGAAPAWIELQQQVDNHLEGFRSSVRNAWIRRAVRMLTLEGPGVLTPTFIKNAANYKDEEWLAREKGYHETSIKSINEAVRVYNTAAPYPVRRHLYRLDVELARCFEDCKPIIQEELRKRAKGSPPAVGTEVEHQGPKGDKGGPPQRAVRESMWRAFKLAVRDIVR